MYNSYPCCSLFKERSGVKHVIVICKQVDKSDKNKPVEVQMKQLQFITLFNVYNLKVFIFIYNYMVQQLHLILVNHL